MAVTDQPTNYSLFLIKKINFYNKFNNRVENCPYSLEKPSLYKRSSLVTYVSSSALYLLIRHTNTCITSLCE